MRHCGIGVAPNANARCTSRQIACAELGGRHQVGQQVDRHRRVDRQQHRLVGRHVHLPLGAEIERGDGARGHGQAAQAVAERHLPAARRSLRIESTASARSIGPGLRGVW